MEKFNSGDDLVRMLLEYRDSLFGFILALARDVDASEEIFQEVSLAVVEEAGRRTRVTRFIPWIHELARRRVAAYFRKNTRRVAIERSESFDDVVAQAFAENASGAHLHLRRREYLDDCIEKLPRTSRRMICRRYRDGASIREIAAAFTWTEEAVNVGLWKARRRLAACITEQMELSHENER
ncbi:MAG: sigma-70 family RNA polymerase sigma factor [Planctomycetes bacterium]|nr:sigma-70 family RNA polymerase sigma factor [Planctomycetota bacterium]